MKAIYYWILLLIFAGNTAMAQRTPLKSGEKAPNVKFQDINGNSYKMYDLGKDKKVLLCFMRPVWCPVCNARTHELMEGYDKLKEKGFEVVVVYPTPAETLKEYAKDQSLPFIVVSDPTEELYGTYQIEKSQQKIAAYSKHAEGKEALKKGKELSKKSGKKYPMKGDQHGPLVPADFVIDAQHNLLNVYYGEFMGDHLPLDTL